MTRTDETESILRQSFMWGTLVSPLAASRIAARVGAERLFGAGVVGAGFIAIMVPAAWLTACHVAIRFIQGIFMVKSVDKTISPPRVYSATCSFREPLGQQLICLPLHGLNRNTLAVLYPFTQVSNKGLIKDFLLHFFFFVF